MDNYLIYVGVAAATILLPGPAVMLTINNAIQRGFLMSMAGILGVSLAILVVATISATSLGIILTSSALAFTVVKILGAAYLIYLGIKMWCSNGMVASHVVSKGQSFQRCLVEGFLVSVSNPKAVIFFMSVFPQFIDMSQAYRPQFLLLAVTFSVLVMLIHTMYALISTLAKTRLSSAVRTTVMNKASGGVFVAFGVGLVASNK